jgi:DNA-binding MarR family transcriptional regulator
MTQWLDDDEMRAWRSLISVFTAVESSLETDLVEKHGLTLGDYAVLVALSEHADHRRRMCDLAGILHLSPSGLTRRIDGLVRQGLVSREPLPDDRRVALAVITPKGLTKLEAAAPDHVEGVRTELLNYMSRTQIRLLGHALSSVEYKRRAALLGDPEAGYRNLM